MKKYIFSLLALLMMTACVDDEGSYKYSKLNEVDIQGIEERYAGLAYFDKITISPELAGSLLGEDLSHYDFKWSFCLSGHNHVTISEEKDLDWLAEVLPGTYTLYFTVTDRQTGLEKQTSTTVVLSDPYTRGFLVLGDDVESNQVRMDMISMPEGRDTAYIKNVFENTEGIQGAQQLLYSGPNSTEEHHRQLWLLSENRSHKITFSDEFKIIGEVNEFEDFIEVDADHKTPIVVKDVFPRQSYNTVSGVQGAMNRGRTYRGMVTEDMILICSTSYQSDYFVQPINRYSPSSQEYFKPYPMAFLKATTTYTYSDVPYTLFYDMDNQKFAKITSSGVYGVYLDEIADYQGGQWNLNIGNSNRSLVYAENGMNFYQGENPSYLIMKDNEADNYYIAYFSWKENKLNLRVPSLYKSRLYSVNNAVAPDFGRASHYMFSSNNSVILYSIGNRLYMYDYARGTCKHHDFDGEITYLEAEYPSIGSIKDYFVATYDQTTGKAMIYKMEVSEKADAGFSFYEDQQWETDMRVKDIEWKVS